MSGDITAQYGSFDKLPIHFLDQVFTPEELIPLLAVADVALCTPLRDNLSLTAIEFIFCQAAREDELDRQEHPPGVLILSEFTGSVQSLRATALTVNPWDTNGFAEAILEALEMDDDEKLAR